MSSIIQRVLFERLSRHQAWQRFCVTYRSLTGEALALKAPEAAGAGPCRAVIDVRGVQVGVLECEATALRRDAAALAARVHLLEIAAESFSALLSESHVHDHEQLPAVVLKTCRWIRRHALNDSVRLNGAARACGVSPSHLSRLFHRSTGLTFQDYVTRYRLEHACERLRASEQPVTDIAFESGFQSISQFHRAFKAVYGVAPRQYRRQARA